MKRQCGSDGSSNKIGAVIDRRKMDVGRNR